MDYIFQEAVKMIVSQNIPCGEEWKEQICWLTFPTSQSKWCNILYNAGTFYKVLEHFVQLCVNRAALRQERKVCIVDMTLSATGLCLCEVGQFHTVGLQQHLGQSKWPKASNR